MRWAMLKLKINFLAVKEEKQYQDGSYQKNKKKVFSLDKIVEH